MTQKIYKTSRGKIIDMGALMLQNEKVRAVGNMNVNARGDRIDANGNIIDEKNRRIQRQIQNQAGSAAQEHRDYVESQKQGRQADQQTVEPAKVDLIPGLDKIEAPMVEEPAAGLSGALIRAKKKQTPKEE